MYDSNQLTLIRYCLFLSLALLLPACGGGGGSGKGHKPPSFLLCLSPPPSAKSVGVSLLSYGLELRLIV